VAWQCQQLGGPGRAGPTGVTVTGTVTGTGSLSLPDSGSVLQTRRDTQPEAQLRLPRPLAVIGGACRSASDRDSPEPLPSPLPVPVPQCQWHCTEFQLEVRAWGLSSASQARPCLGPGLLWDGGNSESSLPVRLRPTRMYYSSFASCDTLSTSLS
jgi:hypothetical protein